MALRGSVIKQNRLPATPPTRSAGSREARIVNTEMSWAQIHRPLETAKGTSSHKSRPLTVYDILPSSLGDKDYQTWTDDWLPRLAESRGCPGQKNVNPISRNPIGFAISPRRTTASVATEIGPTVLHFNGVIKKKRGDTGDKGIKVIRSVKTKPIRRVYTKSAFKREESPTRADAFQETRPMSTRKSLSQRSITPSSTGTLPKRYQFPAEGEEREQMSAILPEARLENYMEPERRKYVVLSQSVHSSTSSPDLKEHGNNNHLPCNGRVEEQLEQYGVRHNPYNMISVKITRKGTLRHGHAWKMVDPRPDHDEVIPPLFVENTGPRRRQLNTVRVKDDEHSDIIKMLSERSKTP